MFEQLSIAMELECIYRSLSNKKEVTHDDFDTHPEEAIFDLLMWVEVRGLLSHEDVIDLMNEYRFDGKSLREVLKNEHEKEKLWNLVALLKVLKSKQGI